MIPTDPQGHEDLPGAASQREAATPETGRPRAPRLRWLRWGRAGRPQGARTRDPRLQRRCSARRALSSTAARPRSAAAAAQSRSPRPLPPPSGLEEGPSEHCPRSGRRCLHRSLRCLSLGLGRRHHRPHAPQLLRGLFLLAPPAPPPDLNVVPQRRGTWRQARRGPIGAWGLTLAPPLPRPRLTW